MVSEKITLNDQVDRNRFISETGTGFTVTAPAGVGKTYAIVERVVNIAIDSARTAKDLEDLSKIVVVTYTNKAAEEMQLRARNSLLATPQGASIAGYFNRIFFGTIHSFCLNIVRNHGHILGVPSSIEIADESQDIVLWNEFLMQFDMADIMDQLDSRYVDLCLKHIPIDAIIDAAKDMPVFVSQRLPKNTLEYPDLSSLMAHVPSRKNSQPNIDKGKGILRKWEQLIALPDFYAPVPEFDKGGEEFKTLWKETFNPMRDWLANVSLQIALKIARQYRQFRIDNGKITYDDQTNIALDLLKNPESGKILREFGYSIILDEAQDTDPEQFRVLLELTRPPDAKGIWIDDGGAPPQKGRFSMVGDPQQSIYSKRADTAFYRKVSDQLIKSKSADALTFHVTFRCSKRVSEVTNRICPVMLDGKEEQVKYVELIPRPDAQTGQVVRLDIKNEIEEEKPSVSQKATAEAEQLADWLKKNGYAKLGASCWGEVAILCPRKSWLLTIENEISRLGLPSQNHSSHEKVSASAATAWFTALMICVTDPDNGFEIVGVLREVFGISDDEIYQFSQGDGTKFSISKMTETKGMVGDTLNRLHEIRKQCLSLPLLDSVHNLMNSVLLFERLRELDKITNDRSEEILNSLIARAAIAEADGISIYEWAEELRLSLNNKVEASVAQRNAIQLMTCQSAKGLEWDVVILPMMFRKISMRSPEYPHVIKKKSSGTADIVFSKEWEDETAKEIAKRDIFQENQRLLYVSMTRARKTLILTNDSALFKAKDSVAEKDSFAECLKIKESGVMEFLQKLPAEIHLPSIDKALSESIEKTKPVTAARPDIKKALKASSSFPSRILPHSLAKHLPALPEQAGSQEAEPEKNLNYDPEWNSNAGEEAIQYGLAWHSLMEALDWKEPSTWDGEFERAFGKSQMKMRAKGEWKLFKDSETAKRLSGSNVVVKTEIPFLMSKSAQSCVEGFIDLVAYDKKTDEWIVLDWKTNKIAESDIHTLADIYAPQLAEYHSALKSSLAKTGNIQTLIYSSATGKTVEINQNL